MYAYEHFDMETRKETEMKLIFFRMGSRVSEGSQGVGGRHRRGVHSWVSGRPGIIDASDQPL